MSDADREETIQARRQRLSVIPRACEACRIRKTRCDRSIPCSNCRSSGIACRPITSTPETRAKSDRVTQLENLVATLSKRLSLVEDKLSGHETPPEVTKTYSISTSHSPDSAGNAAADPLYEGRSSFNTQSAQASEFARIKADSNGIRGGPELDASITYLTTLLQPSGSTSSVEDHYFSPNPTSRLQAPLTPLPTELVVAIIQKIKVNPPMVMTSFPVNDSGVFESLCQKICFPTDAVSIGQVTVMHGILYFTIKEYVAASDPLCKDYDLKMHLEKCKQKFNVGIETYEMLAIPNFENIFALTLGILKALSEAKLLLASSLMSAATSHCQMLGYHSESSYRNDSPRKADSKRRLFWTIYYFDKSNSLLLGHASRIQDSEVDVRYPDLSSDPTLHPWEKIFHHYLQMASFQGDIYSKLYSPSALKADPASRAQVIQNLKTNMTQWRADLAQVDCTNARYAEILALSTDCWDIVYYSALTLVFRASSIPGTGGELTSECFQTARLCLQTHIRCFSAYSGCDILTETDYANSIFYFASFTPFVVVFLHSIAVSSLEDVQLLESVTKVLEKVHKASKGTGRLYEICATFVRLAKGLVESQTSCLGTYNEQDDSVQFSSHPGQLADLRPEDLQMYFGPNMMDYITDSEALDMSTILADWANGPPSAAGFFSSNPEDAH